MLQNPFKLSSDESSSGSRSSEMEKGTIIVVDDEEGILQTYEHYLGAEMAEGVIQSVRLPLSGMCDAPEAQYNLLLCRTGETAVDAARREYRHNQRIQIGFFDMKMPGGIDGLETIRQIRAIDKDIYCIIVTAYQDRSLDEISKVFGTAYDHWDYMNKPFTGNEIIQKARNAMALWRRRRRHEAVIREMEETNRKLSEEFKRRVSDLESARNAIAEKQKPFSTTDEV